MQILEKTEYDDGAEVTTLSELCRLCGSSEGNCLNLFCDEGVEEDLLLKIQNAVRITLREIPSQINECLNGYVTEVARSFSLKKISVAKDDDLPKKVCSTCRDNILNYDAFYQQCHDTQEKLREFLSIQSALWETQDVGETKLERNEGKLTYYEDEVHIADDPDAEEENSQMAIELSPMAVSQLDGMGSFSHQGTSLESGDQLHENIATSSIKKDGQTIRISTLKRGMEDTKEYQSKRKCNPVKWVVQDSLGNVYNLGVLVQEDDDKNADNSIINWEGQLSKGEVGGGDGGELECPLFSSIIEVPANEILVEEDEEAYLIENDLMGDVSDSEIVYAERRKKSNAKSSAVKKLKKHPVTKPYLVLGDGRLMNLEDVEKNLPIEFVPKDPLILLLTSLPDKLPPTIVFNDEVERVADTEVEDPSPQITMPSGRVIEPLPKSSKLPRLELQSLFDVENQKMDDDNATSSAVLGDLVVAQDPRKTLILNRKDDELGLTSTTRYVAVRSDASAKKPKKKVRVRVTRLNPSGMVQTPKCPEAENYMETISENPPKTKCKVCGEVYMQRRQCNYHVRTKHLNVVPFECDSCDKKFAANFLLKRHIESCHHPRSDFICSKCGIRLKSKDVLMAHELRHTSEPPYKCEFCGFGFYRKPNYDKHKLEKHAEKTCICDLCGAAFSSVARLKEHHVTHTGGLQCGLCGKTFFHKSSLQTHMRRHEEEPYCICGFCAKKFSSSYTLRVHEQNACRSKASNSRFVEKRQKEEEIQKNQLKEKSLDSASEVLKVKKPETAHKVYTNKNRVFPKKKKFENSRIVIVGVESIEVGEKTIDIPVADETILKTEEYALTSSSQEDLEASEVLVQLSK